MIELIRQRLASYQVNNALEEEQAIKEILQEVTLYLLWRGRFFDVAAFQGGTGLRILHGTAERESLRLWGHRFFSAKVAQLVA